MKNIADSLGIKVIVEGVENEFQQTEAQYIGCYLSAALSKPSPPTYDPWRRPSNLRPVSSA